MLGLAGCGSVPTQKAEIEPADFPIHGIDVSYYQGVIDWDAVRAGGTHFAFIKATEGGDHKDVAFDRNWTEAARAGVPRGAYHFYYWCRPAHEQVAWFKAHVPADPTALPPVLDLEWNGHSKTCPKKVPRAHALAEIRHFLAEIEAHYGKRAIIYTDITFHKDVLAGELPNHPYWLRSIKRHPTERFGRRWHFWQYTAAGRVPGIKGDVDRNAFAGSAADWKRVIEAGR